MYPNMQTMMSTLYHFLAEAPTLSFLEGIPRNIDGSSKLGLFLFDTRML